MTKASASALPPSNPDGSQLVSRVLRMRDVSALTSLSNARLYELIAAGQFPKPFKLISGGRACGWMSDTIYRWLEHRAQEGK